MSSTPTLDELFEPRIIYPDVGAQERLGRLVGLDDQKKRLTRIVCLLVNPSGLNSWAQKYHPQSKVFITSILRRLPLVVLSGDVGSGKTELAETVGDAVARLEKISISLFPLSLSTRGQGRVGEMTQLLSAAFEYAISEANRLKSSSAKSRGGVILLVDEADALAQSRESAQMHHEDRAGVNAFVRGIDRISKGNLPLAVIMCTNRLQALDPALRRRAADILTFGRPDETLRRAVLSDPLTQLGLSKTDIETLVSVTGAQKEHKYGFTFSDLTQRLLPAIVLDAYPTSAVNSIRAMEIARRMVPTPPFQEGAT